MKTDFCGLDSHLVGLLRGHVAAVSVIALAVAVVGAVFVFARPSYHPEVTPTPPDHGLPYRVVSHTAADARRAFATQGIALTKRSQIPEITTLGNASNILEVSAFGERTKVEKAGFYNYTTDANGRYVHFPRDCSSGVPGVAGSYDAELWRGNIRVIVNCDTAGKEGAAWPRRAQLALARLEAISLTIRRSRRAWLPGAIEDTPRPNWASTALSARPARRPKLT
jgi:hypothetical protein